MSAITFDVIDTVCEATDKSFFPPRVVLTTTSVTRIATVRGYPEYIPSVPPKRYKTLTWAGTSEQTAVTTGTGDKVGDAKYVYSGSGSIDGSGAQVTSYAKDFYTPCAASHFSPQIAINPVVPVLQGYCWPADPNTCPTCTFPPEFKANASTNGIFDEPVGLIGVGTGFRTITPTTLTNIGMQSIAAALQDGGPGGSSGVPKDVFNGFLAAWVIITANHNYTATLSDEYTDAEALTNAQVINSNGATAENLPRTTGLVSRFTAVTFKLSFSNLIVGQSYLASVSFLNMNPNSITVKQYGFVAAAATHVINDSVTNPASGGTSTVRAPLVTFAP